MKKELLIPRFNFKYEFLRFRNYINKLNLPSRSSLFFTAINLLTKGAAFVFTPIFTRILTPSEYGEFSLFSTYLSVAMVLVSLELPGGVIMRAFQREKELHHISLISGVIISLAMAFPATLLLSSVRFFSFEGLNFPFSYFFLFISAISLSVINMFVSRSKFLYKWVPLLILSIAQSILAPIISIVLLNLGYFENFNHVTIKIGSVSAVLFSIAAVLLFIFIKNAKIEISNKKIKKKELFSLILNTQNFLLKLSLPLLPYYFAVMLISQADKLFISEFLGKESLAKYSVAYSAAIALCAVTNGIFSSLSPWIMRKVRGGDFGKIRSVLDIVISLFVCVVIVFLSIAPNFFTILAPSDYMDALPVIYVISLIPIPLTLSQCMSSIAIAKEKTMGVLICGIIPLIVTLVLNFAFTRNSAIVVPAIITAFGYFLLMILSVANARRITGKFILNVNKTFQKLILLIFTSAAIFTFKDFLFLRFLVAAITSIYTLYMLRGAFSLLKEKKSPIESS